MNHQNYFFTHGANDQRMYVSHFNFIKNYSTTKGLKAEYWLIPNGGHVDSIFLHPEEYGQKGCTDYYTEDWWVAY